MAVPDILLQFSREPAPIRFRCHGIALPVLLGLMLAFGVAHAAPPCTHTLDAAVQEKPPAGLHLKIACLVGGVRMPCVEYRLDDVRLVAVYDPDHPDHLLGVKVNGRALVCWNGRQRDL